MYKVIFEIGDWSHDGHNQSFDAEVMSSVPVKELRELHFAAKDYLGFDIGDICREHENTSLSEYQEEVLTKVGILPPVIDPKNLDEDEVVLLWVNALLYVAEQKGERITLRILTGNEPSQISSNVLKKMLPFISDHLPAHLSALSVDDIASILNSVSKGAEESGRTFKFELNGDDKVPTMHFYGFDEQKRHLQVPGYGVFNDW